MHKISIHEYFMEKEHLPLLDVRSPIEYQKGHIPGAHSLPLFSNEERAEIGILYKEKGQEQAIDKGLSIAGSKMNIFYQNTIAQSHSRHHHHCKEFSSGPHQVITTLSPLLHSLEWTWILVGVWCDSRQQ